MLAAGFLLLQALLAETAGNALWRAAFGAPHRRGGVTRSTPRGAALLVGSIAASAKPFIVAQFATAKEPQMVSCHLAADYASLPTGIPTPLAVKSPASEMQR